MARTVRTAHACTECGAASPRWVGRCPSCGAWNTLVEEVLERSAPARASGPVAAPVPITEVAAQTGAHRPTGVEELDRVLGGGLVPGSVVLLAGEPGIGKSTLLLGVLAGLAADGQVLYVCAEESREQVRLRRAAGGPAPGAAAGRRDRPGGRPVPGRAGPAGRGGGRLGPDRGRPELAGAPGGVGQVREVAAQLVRLAKERSIATFLVGQVTKDGAVAGPKTLEHLVDVVLNFEGDQHHALRLVRCTKNRFGPAYEVGCFEMTEAGLEPVADPSRLFLSARTAGVPGVACTVSPEGRRPLVTEVQALVVPTGVAVPRRTAQGLDAAAGHPGRRARPPGPHRPRRQRRVRRHRRAVRITEPAADLAVCLALASAAATGRCPPSWSPSARSAWAARSARCPSRRAGSPRRPGWASAAPSSPPPACPTGPGPPGSSWTRSGRWPSRCPSWPAAAPPRPAGGARMSRVP